MTVPSLYELIKQKSKEKGRPLKIICDWDECLMPVRPWIVYLFLGGSKPDFKEFLQRFWENVSVAPGSIGGDKAIKITENGMTEKERSAIKKFSEMKDKRRQGEPQNDFYNSPQRFKAPFLSTTQDLLKALSEDLISELIIISAMRRGRTKRENKKYDLFEKTFGQFPQCKINIYEMFKKMGGKIPHRNEWIRDNYPNFDIFIDDNHYVIEKTRKSFSADKTFVLPDYKYSRGLEAPNIHHIKTTVSDLKDSDFVIAALELKTKQLGQELAIAKQEREQLIEWLGVG